MPKPRTIRLPRPALLTEDRLASIHQAALRILQNTGLRLRSPEAADALGRAASPLARPGRPAPISGTGSQPVSGLRLEADRVLFDPKLVDDFVAETRAQHSGRGTVAEPDPHITLGVCQYATHLHDLQTDEIVPATADRLTEAAKFLDTLAPFGVIGKTPGTPMDAPADLQPLLKYKIQALHCRLGKGPVELASPRATPFIMDMAEALGHPVTSADVYVVSPLTLGGDSLNCALAGKSRLKSLWVSNMSSLGATAPIRLGDALALGVAEVVGAAIVAREAVGLPVEWSIRVCPFDPRAMALTLGGPEELLLQWANEEVNAWYHGRPVGPPGGSLHSQAKLPDQQAAAERMAIMATHALFGTRLFVGIGRLSLDEVFSAEQAIIDLEIRDHVQRLISGLEVDCDPEACAAEVAAGVADGFLALDSTVTTYQHTYWRPRLFWRGMLAEWQRTGAPDLRRRAQEMVRHQLKQWDYHLEPDLRREVERIYAHAEKQLSA